MLIAILEDRVFRKKTKEPYTKRWTVRAFAYNKQGKLAFLRIEGTDSLGRRNHLETIGGGVENEETLVDALHREVREEIGYTCEIIEEVGSIVDHYNFLNRETISNFFVIQLKDHIGKEERSREEESLISGVEYMSEAEALKELSVYEKNTVNELVQRRDLLAFEFYLATKDKRNK